VVVIDREHSAIAVLITADGAPAALLIKQLVVLAAVHAKKADSARFVLRVQILAPVR